jgi:hypothetical protein
MPEGQLAKYALLLTAKSEKFSQDLDRAERRAQKFNKAMMAVGAAVAGVLSSRAILRGGKELLRAFSVQQDAVESLRASLLVTGKTGSAALQLLTENAARLQQATTKGDEAIIQATASIAQLATELSATDLASAQEALVGIADAFFKGDVQAAALIVGKSIGSATNALTRYGIQLDVAASQQEKLAQIMAQSDKFYAVSAARAATLSGRAQQLSNAFGDLKETLGGMLEEALGITEFLEKMTRFVSGMNNLIAQGKVAEAFESAGKLAGDLFVLGFLKALEGLPDLTARAFEKIPLIGRLLQTGVNIPGFVPVIGPLSQAQQGMKMVAAATEGPFANALADAIAAREQAILDTLANLPQAGGIGPVQFRRGMIPIQGAGQNALERMRAWGRFVGMAQREQMPDYPERYAEILRGAQDFNRAADITVAAFGEMVAAAKWGSRSMVEYFVQGLGEILKALSKGKTGGAWGFVAGAGEAFASFQHGGVVPGMPGTAVPILAHAGETVVPRGGAPVNVYQSIYFNVAAMDAVGVQEVLRRNKGAVAQVVAEAAQEFPDFARALRGI